MAEAPTDSLICNLIGKIPHKNKLLLQGLTFGIMSFIAFEFFQVINPNLPRIPVPWLIMVVVPIIQVVFISKILAILRVPRKEDIFFTLGLSYEQRRNLALSAFESTHITLKIYTIASITVAIILEILVLHIYSPVELLIPPLVLFLWIYLLSNIGMLVIRSGIISPVKNDRQLSNGSVSTSFGEYYARFIMIKGLFISRIAPQSIRAIVLRNIFYLFRSEPLLLPLQFIAAPVLLVVMILIIGDSHSPFVDLFSAVCFFAVVNWYASLLRDASVNAIGNPVYSFGRVKILKAFVWTVLLFTIPVILVYTITILPILATFSGILRFVTSISVMIVSACIAGAIVYDPLRKDGDQATGWGFFAGSCIGVFISWFGLIFPILVFTAFVLKEWRCITTESINENL